MNCMQIREVIYLFVSVALICLTPYNRKYNVLSASLNKTFPSISFDLSCPKLENMCILYCLIK